MAEKGEIGDGDGEMVAEKVGEFEGGFGDGICAGRKAG